jgi:adenosylcobinamide-GDP ribazoletransferase
VTGLVLAVRYLTIVPLPGRTSHGREALGRAASWFPVVGLGIGVVLVGVERVTSVLFPSLLAALLTVTAWKVLTGGLHLDGLADCLDGLAGHDAAQRLSIMRDSRIGAFGAIGLILFLLLEIAAITELPADVRWRALLVLPALARATPPLLARCFTPAKVAGHGAAFREGLREGAPPVALGLALVLAWVALGWPGLLVVAASLVAAFAVAAFMAVRLAGVTGDVLGAAIEVAELAGLLTVSAWAHVRP